jgi:hypothetical protein
VHQVRQRSIGDPGLFSFLKKVSLKGVIGGLNKVVTGAAGFIPGGKFAVEAADALFPGGRVGAQAKPLMLRTGNLLTGGTIGPIDPGAISGIAAAHAAGIAAGRGGKRYRRMNPLNYRALVRSTRRIHRASKIMRTVFSQAKRVHAPRRQPRGVRGYRRRKVA